MVRKNRIGNVNNFSKIGFFKFFYIKLTKENRQRLFLYFTILFIIIVSVIVFRPKNIYTGPIAQTENESVELTFTECVTIDGCNSNYIKNDRNSVIKLTIDTNSPISVLGIDKDGEAVQNIIARNVEKYWEIDIPKTPILITVTQNFKKYQIIIR